ncbi:MAG: DUF177 domain-containing protein [Polyangiaceae bacterium]
MGAHEFTIPVSELDAAGRSYHFPIRAAWVMGALEDHEATSAGTEGKLDVRVSKSGNDVVVHGTMRAELTMPCARCMDPVKVLIDQPISVLMVPEKALKSPESASRRPRKEPAKDASAKETTRDTKEAKAKDAPKKGRKERSRDEEDDDDSISPDEADIVAYDGDTVVLDDLVRDELVLETPMIPLCSEDCPGISPGPHGSAGFDEPAGEKPLDPRLAPLLRLKKREKE